jgi:mRNA interferase MazF
MWAEFQPGEVYWAKTEHGKGHEQRGRRPVVVVTDSRITAMGLTWAIPLSTTRRGWPTHVQVEVGGQTSYAMCEQLRATAVERLDGRLGRVAYEQLAEIRSVLHSIIGH